jgi:hypothetical protein
LLVGGSSGGKFDTLGKPTYNVTLQASDFVDGAHVARCILYPASGQPIVLASLPFNTNYGGTLTTLTRYVATTGNDSTGTGTSGNPYLTIKKAANSLNGLSFTDAFIYCKAGTYALGSTDSPHPTTVNGWIYVTVAPGVAMSAVIIDSHPGSDWFGIYTKLACYRGVTFQPTTLGNLNTMFQGTADVTQIWIDDCDLVGPDAAAESGDWLASGLAALYVTNVSITNCLNGTWQFNFALWRNVIMDHTSGGGGQASTNFVYMNFAVMHTDSTGLDPDLVHSHTFQVYAGAFPIGPGIIYGCHNVVHPGGGIGLLTGTSALTDLAIVDTNIDLSAQTDVGATSFYFNGATRNLYVKDSSFPGGASPSWGDTFTGTKCVIENTTFATSPPTSHSGVTYR